MSKSCTLQEQKGNPLPRSINSINIGKGYCHGSLNSEGLPNSGIDYYISNELTDTIKSYKKPYFLSLSGLSLNDNIEMLSRAFLNDNNGMSITIKISIVITITITITMAITITLTMTNEYD